MTEAEKPPALRGEASDPKGEPSGLDRRSNWLAFLASLVMCAAVLEGASRYLENRAKGRAAAPTARLAMMRANPTGSYRLLPNLDLVARVGGHAIPIRTNSHGMRWREIPLGKPAGVQRVAFLGDSFTFGCWSSRIEDSFVGSFEGRLDRTRFEALNFGVGGYGLDDMELLLHEEVASFAPDWVVVMFFDGNDFRDTYLGVQKYDVVDGTAKLDAEVLRQKLPEYAHENEPFALKAAPDPSRLRRLLRRSAALRTFFPSLGAANSWLEFRPSRYFTSFSYWSQFPYPPRAQQARDVSLETLGRMQAFCTEKGARLLVAAIPAREQVYSVVQAGSYFDIGLPQAFVQAFAADHGIPFLDLLPALRERAERGAELYVPGDIHLNTEGHLLVGEMLHSWFARIQRAPEERLPQG